MTTTMLRDGQGRKILFSEFSQVIVSFYTELTLEHSFFGLKRYIAKPSSFASRILNRNQGHFFR